MEKMIPLDKKPTVNISILGDESSGITTLRYAIAKYFWPKLKAPYSAKVVHPELRECGSADPSKKFEYETESRNYSQREFQSDPFHYLGGLAMGAPPIDGVILLITASEGVMPQIKLLVMAAHQLRVPRLVIFINKTDLIEDSEKIDLIEMELRALLDQYHFDGKQTPIIKGSAFNARNGEAKGMEAIITLMNAVDQYISTPVMASEKPFLMAIEEVFSHPDIGLWVNGRVEKGSINSGDPVEIVGMMKDGEKPLTAVFKGIKMFRKTLNRAETGDNASIILQGVDKDAIHRGMVICAPGSVNQNKVFSAEVVMLGINQGAPKTSYFNGNNLHFRLRTASVIGQITLPKEIGVVLPGDTAHIKITLQKAIVMEVGLPFYITTEKGLRIGVGRITEILD